MDVISKRILTPKSLIKFGMYKECTVQQIYDIHNISELIQMYCNLSKIDYNEEVLKMLHIPEDKRIKKPGKNPKLKYELIRNYWQVYKKEVGEEQYMHSVVHAKKIRKRSKAVKAKGDVLIRNIRKESSRMSSLSKK